MDNQKVESIPMLQWRSISDSLAHLLPANTDRTNSEEPRRVSADASDLYDI